MWINTLIRGYLRYFRPVLLSGSLLFLQPADGSTVLYPVPDSTTSSQFDWIEEIEARIPPLTHEIGDRWPLALWRVISPDEISPQVASMLLQRGLVPSLPLEDERTIQAARILQKAGSPVVVTSGVGVGNVWPYNLNKDTDSWAYKFEESGTAIEEKLIPVPTRFAGWAEAASDLRRTLGELKAQNIVVDAAWLDYEGLPVLSDYRTALASTNGKHWLPRAALKSENSFADFTRRLWITLLSTYIAAPFREVYPDISVTNWVAVLSLPEFPAIGWSNKPLPLISPTLFTSTNPVAYGIDVAFNKTAQLNAMSTQNQVDAIYLELLLRQVSADSYARSHIAPELNSVVWIARWVRDDPSKATPMMSRPAYREALRHLWLRGVDAMEIFSPVREGFTDLAIQEVEDATLVYDEMLEFSNILEHGDVLNYEYKSNSSHSALWSGLRMGDLVLIRCVSLDEGIINIITEPWPDIRITVPASPLGKTFLGKLDRKARTVSLTDVSQTTTTKLKF